MKKLKNPFTTSEEFSCIGCSPSNPIGFQLEFYLDEENGILTTEWNPQPLFQGYKNVVHGGIQATLMDEIASWVVYSIIGTGGVTSQMHVRYRKPTFITDGPLKVKAQVEKHEKKLADIKTQLYNNKNELCAEATVQYFVFPENIAKEKYGYPGKDAFF
ncbi:MAG: PaaI family thioesterase [Bacteroidales bacterium]